MTTVDKITQGIFNAQIRIASLKADEAQYRSLYYKLQKTVLICRRDNCEFQFKCFDNVELDWRSFKDEQSALKWINECINYITEAIQTEQSAIEQYKECLSKIYEANEQF